MVTYIGYVVAIVAVFITKAIDQHIKKGIESEYTERLATLAQKNKLRVQQLEHEHQIYINERLARQAQENKLKVQQLEHEHQTQTEKMKHEHQMHLRELEVEHQVRVHKLQQELEVQTNIAREVESLRLASYQAMAGAVSQIRYESENICERDPEEAAPFRRTLSVHAMMLHDCLHEHRLIATCDCIWDDIHTFKNHALALVEAAEGLASKSGADQSWSDSAQRLMVESDRYIQDNCRKLIDAILARCPGLHGTLKLSA